MLPGTQIMPPEYTVVPPIVAPFSNRPTLAPSSAAVTAAVSPAAPVPNTMTS